MSQEFSGTQHSLRYVDRSREENSRMVHDTLRNEKLMYRIIDATIEMSSDFELAIAAARLEDALNFHNLLNIRADFSKFGYAYMHTDPRTFALLGFIDLKRLVPLNSQVLVEMLKEGECEMERIFLSNLHDLTKSWGMTLEDSNRATAARCFFCVFIQRYLKGVESPSNLLEYVMDTRRTDQDALYSAFLDKYDISYAEVEFIASEGLVAIMDGAL